MATYSFRREQRAPLTATNIEPLEDDTTTISIVVASGDHARKQRKVMDHVLAAYEKGYHHGAMNMPERNPFQSGRRAEHYTAGYQSGLELEDELKEEYRQHHTQDNRRPSALQASTGRVRAQRVSDLLRAK